MFDTQTGHIKYSGLLKKYFVQQITALTSPASAERLNQNLGRWRSRKAGSAKQSAFLRYSDWSGRR